MPAAGAGNLEVPGAQDNYTFSATAGDTIVLDVLSGSNTTFRWRISAPDSSVLFDGLYADRQLALTQTGTHTITVYGLSPTSSGAYSFRLLLSPAPQNFAIAIGDTVSDGVPAAGAGNLEAPGSLDIYSFAGAAGQSVIFDWLSGSNGVIGWRLNAPDGAVLFDVFLVDIEQTLPQTGTYTLTLRGNQVTSVGTYSFTLLLAPEPQNFTIAIGDTVSADVPGPGAGNLEAPGAQDNYSFDVVAGQQVIFDWLSGSTACWVGG
ncbi:MAG: hypothetical protein IPK19_14835 [Chloroflexi bacterium]|nr:hypothetical protein [Chloroflexota bacterium]